MSRSQKEKRLSKVEKAEGAWTIGEFLLSLRRLMTHWFSN